MRAGPVQHAQQPVPMMQQQMLPRGRVYRYPPGRNVPDVSMPGVPGGMLSVPYDMSGMMPRDAAIGQPLPIPALATALANAPPDQQRTMLGENLYPLVDQLEHEHAAKVTGMLLEMDQTEVLHLLESPDALKAKAAEAMEVLRNVVAQQQSNRICGSGVKVADDARGRGILEELEADGIDTSFLVVSKEGNSPFTYVIVDKQTKTRTCIHTPGFPPMIPDDLSESSLLSALDGVRLIYLDGRLHETALVVAREANRRGIPILIDAERKREGLDDLFKFSDYVVCSAKFPQAWTEAPSVPSALVAMLLRLPNVKFVIVTLGEDGCIMLQRSITEGDQSEEMDIDSLLESLKQRNDSNTVIPTCVSSVVTKLRAHGIGTVSGRLFVGTAEKIPSSELLDTTGAGDAFIGAVLYAICASMQPEKMLLFAAQVAAAGCRALGARAGLPYLTDPRLAPFL